MAKVSFGSCTAVQLAAKVTGSMLVPRRIYFVTNGTILSIVHALTNNTYQIVYQDAIASRPLFNAKGFQLGYVDASGVSKLIDLSSMTIGDRSLAAPLPMNTYEGQYMGTIGGVNDSPDYTALPTTGVRFHDDYKCVTAGTYGGIVLAVGEHVRAASVTPTWEKNTTVGLAVGVLQNTDTLQQAFAKVVNNMDIMGESISAKADKIYVDGNFFKKGEDIGLGGGHLYLSQDAVDELEPVSLRQAQAMIVSFMKLQVSPASVAAFNALTGIKVGYSYRITVAGTYAGQVCEVGDMIVAIATTDGTTANSTWLVLQNNIDLAGVFTTVGVGLEEVAGASGKTVRMPIITQTNSTNGTGAVAFGANVTIVDSITRDSYGRVTAVNTKTITLPSETVISGLSSNAQAAYKIMVNMTSAGHALTATYTDILLLAMTGWTTDANVGNIVVGDTLKGALNRLQNRSAALETRATTIEGLQDWIDG